MEWSSETIKFHQCFFLSFTTGSIASFITNPLDIVKIRMQVQRAEQKNNNSTEKDLSKVRFGYKNIFDGLYKIWHKEGGIGMFRGVNARIINMSIASSINITLLETFRTFIYNNCQH